MFLSFLRKKGEDIDPPLIAVALPEITSFPLRGIRLLYRRNNRSCRKPYAERSTLCSEGI